MCMRHGASRFVCHFATGPSLPQHAPAQAVFRCDVLLLLGLVSLQLLASRQLSLGAGVACGLGAAAASLTVSVGVDSFFWRRWLWPEGEVLWFNTVLNK
jgi:alpha-1,6-mannosyltransferase